MTDDPYTIWCEINGVHHAHCPLGCEHPQPFVSKSGNLWCGRCWHVDGVLTRMVPCDDTIC